MSSIPADAGAAGNASRAGGRGRRAPPHGRAAQSGDELIRSLSQRGTSVRRGLGLTARGSLAGSGARGGRSSLTPALPLAGLTQERGRPCVAVITDRIRLGRGGWFPRRASDYIALARSSPDLVRHGLVEDPPGCGTIGNTAGDLGSTQVFSGHVADHHRAEVGLARLGADAGELVGHVLDDVVVAAPGAGLGKNSRSLESMHRFWQRTALRAAAKCRMDVTCRGSGRSGRRCAAGRVSCGPSAARRRWPGRLSRLLAAPVWMAPRHEVHAQPVEGRGIIGLELQRLLVSVQALLRLTQLELRRSQERS